MDQQRSGTRQSRARGRAQNEADMDRQLGDSTSALAGKIHSIPLTEIAITGRNPRQTMEGMDELTASIREHGLLQPLVVRRDGDQFELIAGHRRLEAMKQLGWQEALAVVRSADVDEAYILTLVESLQRADLRPTEEAAALETLVRERGWTTRQVAAAIKRSQAYVSKRLRVFEDPLLAPAVLANQLSVSAAEELLTLSDSSRYELLSQAVEQHWDRQRVRAAARDRFAANRRRGRPPGLTRRIHTFRSELRTIMPEQLTEADRRELRLLFSELALLARAPTGPRRRIFPALPVR
jgi:ParB family transcriptional regulator, chromosome partitioning protein